MTNVQIAVLTLVAFTVSFNCMGAGQVNRCTKDGSVTYQSEPCPTSEARQAPTVEQLNAERHKKIRQSGGGARTAGGALSAPPQTSDALQPSLGVSYRCDGRTYCSQMTSCSEAKYFLSHCPSVKMDGDGDGIPCEEQWCNR